MRETEEYEILVRGDSFGTVTVIIAYFDHTSVPDVIPDNTVECSLYDPHLDAPPSDIEEIPKKDARCFEEATERVRQKYGLEYAFEYKHRFTCTACVDNDKAEDGRVHFSCRLRRNRRT